MMKTLSIIVVLCAMTQPCFVRAETVRSAGNGRLNVIVGTDDKLMNTKVSYIWAKDPFFKTPGFVVGTGPKEPILELKGVLLSGDSKQPSLAIINKQTVFVNTIIDGYAVREIGSNYVIVEKNQTLKELQMSPIQQQINAEISIWDRLPAMETDEAMDEENDEN